MGEGERNRAATARIDEEQLEKLAASATPPEQRPTSALDPSELKNLLAQSGTAPSAKGSQPITPPVIPVVEAADDVVELDENDKRTQAIEKQRRPVHRFATGSEFSTAPIAKPATDEVPRFRAPSHVEELPPASSDTGLVVLAALLILALAGGIVFLMVR